MADEALVNGEVSDGRSVEITGGVQSSEFSVLDDKIASLERENVKLVGENEGFKKQVEEMEVAINKLRTDNRDMKVAVEKLESDTQGLKDVAARAAELEAELSRLQHDFASAMSDLDECTTESSELKRKLEGAREREQEKVFKLEAIEKERETLSSGVIQLAAIESALRDEVYVKDEEVKTLKKSIGEMQEFLQSRNNLEKLKFEKEKSIDDMKGEISALENNLKEKEKLIDQFQFKHGTLGNGDYLADEKKGLVGGFEQKHWILGGSVIAAIAVMGAACYLHAARKH